jgi:hypothetical protein
VKQKTYVVAEAWVRRWLAALIQERYETKRVVVVEKYGVDPGEGGLKVTFHFED